MMCKIIMREKMMWRIFMKSNLKKKKVNKALSLYYTSRKPVRCTGKLLKIKSKLILIPFTSFVEYVRVFFFFFVVQNVIGKIDKETLRIGFRIDPTFWFKKITKKVFIIG
jgi:hypothetical protein